MAARLQNTFLGGRFAEAMRILVTGPTNPFGDAVVKALAVAGHSVRAFGVPAGENPFPGLSTVAPFAGNVHLGGSIEPAAAECQAIVHCANLDEAGKDRKAHAIHIEKGTLYARYGAERELVQRFVVLLPATAGKEWSVALGRARDIAEATKSPVPCTVLAVSSPEEAAREVLDSLKGLQVPA